MKRAVCLTICVLVAIPLLAARKVPGRIVFKRETIEVTLLIPVTFSGEINFPKLHSRIRYIDSSGKRTVVRASEALEVSFDYQWYGRVRLLSRKDPAMGSINSHVFLQLVVDGPLKLFKSHTTAYSPGFYGGAAGGFYGGVSYAVENYYLQKGEGELKRPRGLNFRDDMRDYFRDCPELVALIDEGDFRKRDMESIASFYNSKCR